MQSFEELLLFLFLSAVCDLASFWIESVMAEFLALYNAHDRPLLAESNSDSNFKPFPIFNELC